MEWENKTNEIEAETSGVAREEGRPYRKSPTEVEI